MKRKTVIRVTTLLLLIATIVCVGTGLVKWPGLIPTLGLTYRQVPLALITDLHDWSGLMMMVLAIAHVIQFKGMVKRMVSNCIK